MTGGSIKKDLCVANEGRAMPENEKNTRYICEWMIIIYKKKK